MDGDPSDTVPAYPQAGDFSMNPEPHSVIAHSCYAAVSYGKPIACEPVVHFDAGAEAA